MKFRAITMDVTGITTRWNVTTESPERARELLHDRMLDERQRPRTILICIPGGKQ